MDEMLVAQLTDLHLADADRNDSSGNSARFQSCLDMLQALSTAPNLYLITGDIAERGEEGAYRHFLERMHATGRRWLALTGNHDDAARFAALCSGEPTGLLRHADSARLGAWRIVAVDTTRLGMDGAWFDDDRADALAATLDEGRDMPTLLAMHHPPIASGVEWIDPAPDAAWIERLAAVVERCPQVRQIVCGHAHMPVVGDFRGVPALIAPATAAQLWPEFAPFDPRRPDGRIMVIDGQPGFALHRLGDDRVTTTFATPASGVVRLRQGHVAEAG